MTLRPYGEVKGISRYATSEQFEEARSDAAFNLTRIQYQSDGLTVYAYVYAPSHPAGKLPVVVFNRGSFTWDGFAEVYLTTFHRLAKAGFLVLAPMYRGSGGGEGKDEMGGADVHDLLNTAALLERIATADRENVFLYGESRGGMMTYQAIRDHYPARAAAVYGAFSDLADLTRPGAQFSKVATAVWPKYAQEHDEIDRTRSAIVWADQFGMPVLIMHGAADNDVPARQSVALAGKLQELGKPFELVIREGAHHTLPEWGDGRDAYAVDWFRRHMTH